MNRTTAHRGIAALTLTLGLVAGGAQPAAAQSRGIWQHTMDRIVSLWSRGDDPGSTGLWETLSAWWPATQKVSTSSTDTIDQGMGADPMGEDAGVGDEIPTFPGSPPNG